MVKISDKNFCKKFLGIGCCDKTASENDFNSQKTHFKNQIKLINNYYFIINLILTQVSFLNTLLKIIDIGCHTYK